MKPFDDDKVLLLQQLIIKSSGGESGVRDFNLLNSALNSAFQTFDGKELYPTKEEKGAKLGYNLISNHAFVDGNKRIGALVMLSFLEINVIKLKYSDEDLIDLCLKVAANKYNYNDVLKWIKSKKISR